MRGGSLVHGSRVGAGAWESDWVNCRGGVGEEGLSHRSPAAEGVEGDGKEYCVRLK